MSVRFGDPATAAPAGWRTRDIVVAAVIGVAFGVAFFAFQAVWGALGALGPFQNLFYGIWLMPAIVAPLIIRKPGAALFAEMVAAGLSALLGSVWSVDVLLSGFMQGAAAEIVFAATRYRTWSVPVVVLASLAATFAAWIHDWLVYYAAASLEFLLVLAAMMVASALLLLPAASIALVRALRQAGVLEGFPA